jgi:hypothetical protein
MTGTVPETGGDEGPADPQAGVDRLKARWGERWDIGYDAGLYIARRREGSDSPCAGAELAASDPGTLGGWLTEWEAGRANGGWDIAACRRAFPDYTFTREQGQIVAAREGSPTVRDTSHLVILAILRARREAGQVTDAQPPKPWTYG